MTAPNTASPLRIDEDELVAFARENGRKLGIGAAALIVVVGGIWMFQSSARRKEAFASQELMQARSSAEAGNMPLAASDLTRLIDRFSGTKAADEGFILLNQIRLVQGQRDVALNALQLFVRSRHDAHVLASAYALLAGGLEDQGKLRDAAESYRLAAQNTSLDFLKATYLLDAGRALATAGDTVNARKSYAEVLEKYGRLEQAAEARVRMAEIGGTVPPPPAAADSTD